MMTKEKLSDIKVLCKDLQDAKKLYEYLGNSGFSKYTGEFQKNTSLLSIVTYSSGQVSQLNSSEFLRQGSGQCKILTMDEIFDKEESLEEKKQRLSRELQEVEEKIREEQTIRVGDYTICIPTENYGGAGYEEGKIVKVRDISCGVIWYEGDRGYGIFQEYVRKLSKQEVTDYLTIPKEKEYVLKAGNKLRVKKTEVDDLNGTRYQIDAINRLINMEPKIGQIGGFPVTIKEIIYHIGCSSGPDVSITELKEIVAIAESLK